MSEFQRRRAELYAEFPAEAEAYESEYVATAERLAEAERLLSDRCLFIVPDEAWKDRRDAFLGATDSAEACQHEWEAFAYARKKVVRTICIKCGEVRATETVSDAAVIEIVENIVVPPGTAILSQDGKIIGAMIDLTPDPTADVDR